MLQVSLVLTTIGLFVMDNGSSANQRSETEELRSLRDIVGDLSATDDQIRQNAIDALYERPEIDMKPGMVRFPDEYWAHDRAPGIFELRQEARPLLPALIRLLDHSDNKVVSATLTLLARMSTTGRVAIPGLVRLVDNEDADPSLRWEAVQALFWLTPETESVFAKLDIPTGPQNSIFMMYSYDNDFEEPELDMSYVVPSYSQYLGLILTRSGHTKVEIPHIAKATSKQYRREIRGAALLLLAVLGLEARDSVPTVRCLLADEDPFIRQSAASAFFSAHEYQYSVSRLADCLRLPAGEREQFIEIASTIKTERDEMLSYAKIEPDSDTVNILVGAIQYGRGPSRRTAIRILGVLGAASKPAVPELTAALSDADSETRSLAAQALAKIRQTETSDANRAYQPEFRKRTIRLSWPNKHQCYRR